MATVRALICRVGQSPKAEELGDSLEDWQRLVGGYVERVKLVENVWMLCNEDGIQTCPFNRQVPGIAPERPEASFVVIAPDAAPPGQWGIHDVYGNFAIVRFMDGKLAPLDDLDFFFWGNNL